MTLVYSEWTLYRLEAREINFRSAIHLNLERLRWHNKRTKVCFCLFFFSALRIWEGIIAYTT